MLVTQVRLYLRDLHGISSTIFNSVFNSFINNNTSIIHVVSLNISTFLGKLNHGVYIYEFLETIPTIKMGHTMI